MTRGTDSSARFGRRKRGEAPAREKEKHLHSRKGARHLILAPGVSGLLAAPSWRGFSRTRRWAWRLGDDGERRICSGLWGRLVANFGAMDAPKARGDAIGYVFYCFFTCKVFANRLRIVDE